MADDGTLCFDFDPVPDPVPDVAVVVPEPVFLPELDPLPDRDAPDPPVVPLVPADPAEPPDAVVPAAGVAELDPPDDVAPDVAFEVPVVVTFTVTFTLTVQAGVAWPTLAMAVLAWASRVGVSDAIPLGRSV